MSQSSYTLRSNPPPLESDSKWIKRYSDTVIIAERPRAGALISWEAYLMFDFYSFEAETARRSFPCPTHYPVKLGDQVLLVFPSHFKDPGSVTATLRWIFLRGESLRKLPNNTLALNKTCFVAHQFLTTGVTRTSFTCASLQRSSGISLTEPEEESKYVLLTSCPQDVRFPMCGFYSKDAHLSPPAHLSLAAFDAE